MDILIPTLGRANNQRTLHYMGEYARQHATLVVQDHEYKDHKDIHNKILALPFPIKDIAGTKRYLFKQFSGRIILLDDDLQFYQRPDPTKYNLRDAEPHHVMQMLEEMYSSLETFAHAALSAREGNNRIPEDVSYNSRYMRAVGYNLDMIPSDVDPGRVPVMEDFDINLQLLRRGLGSIIYFKYAQGHQGTQTPGGCSLIRNHEIHSRAIDLMEEFHGPFVRRRLKKNKTGGDFGTRDELTIYWKKAYESSKKQDKAA